MFVRKHLVKKIAYLSLVENVWNPIKKRYQQKRLTSLGKLSDLEYQHHRIDKMVTALHEFCQTHGVATLSDGLVSTSLSSNEYLASRTYDFGVHYLATGILNRLGITQTVQALDCPVRATTPRLSNSKVTAVLQTLVAHRLLPRNDASELSSYHWYHTKLFLPQREEVTLTKDDFYRALDVLLSGKDQIERAYYDANRDLFSGGLDLVLFDTTSIYYWGAKGKANEDDLLQYGFSKDGKGDLKQLIVGVLMTSSGVPVAHETFPGNTADVNAFNTIIEIIKQKYQVKDIILIADRGMVSEQNLLTLEQSGYHYILGVRMRRLPVKLQQKLLTPLDPNHPYDDWEMINDHHLVKDYPLEKFTDEEIKEFFLDKVFKNKLITNTFDQQALMAQIKKRRLIVNVNPLQATHDRKQRDFFKRIIQNKIKYTTDKQWIVKNGYKKYVKFPKGVDPILDEAKLESEELYDGKWVIITNRPLLSPLAIGEYYKTLQTIERGFRDLKSLVTIQPIFHWKENRIKAHVFVCFLSLIVKWYICRMLDPHSQEEGRRFIEEMIDLKSIEVDKRQYLYVRTEVSNQAQEQLHKLGIPTPPKLVFDGRTKSKLLNKAHSHAGGRPKLTIRIPGQLNLPVDIF